MPKGPETFADARFKEKNYRNMIPGLANYIKNALFLG
jgi:hypothetical protein